jgi:hypothetical protein
MLGGKGKRGKSKLQDALPPADGGGFWKREPGEREVMRELCVDLGEKRAWSSPVEAEGESYVNESILEIRAWLSEAMERVPQGSHSFASLSAMRETCDEYLATALDPEGGPVRAHFAKALLRWRDKMYLEVTNIEHGLDLSDAHALASRMRASRRSVQ